VVARMMVEIDPAALAPSGTPATRPTASDELRDVALAIGAANLQALVRALSQNIAGVEDRPRAIELVGAINRLLEAAGVSLEADAITSLPPTEGEAPGDTRAVC